MRVIADSDESTGMLPNVATIGFFDGVHRGHRYIIDNVIAEAVSAGGMQSMVVTFDSHPRHVLNKAFQPELLTTASEKVELLSKTGIDNCAVLHFDKSLASLSAYEFMKDVLLARLNVRKLVIGYDNRFGHSRSEGFDDYVRYGAKLGIDVVCSKPFVLNGVNVSSSVIRSFLSAGEAEMAAMCLGYPYFISGTVVSGCREGRKMGFPTANLGNIAAHKLVPEPGVYAVKVRVEGYETQLFGIMNIGTRPTFGDGSVTLETHIIDFNGDIYGRSMSVMFVKRLRAERKFSSPSALAARLQADRDEACRLFALDS